MQRLVWSLTSNDWHEFLISRGQSPRVLEYWLDGLYKNSKHWEGHVNKSFIELAKNEFDFRLPLISQTLKSVDHTIKFQIRFPDGPEVETVLIPFHKRYTVCLSTQVGCAMNCSFCYTGTQGLKRNLNSGEIIGQYIVAKNYLQSIIPGALDPSIVFMGQGEPLHNADELLKAIQIFSDKKIIGLGHRQMTLSTVGYIPGMEKLLKFPRINIALSLHSPFEDQRSQLIPVNLRYPLKEVMNYLDEIPLLARQFITYEYLLIKDFNMLDQHVEELSKLLSHRKAILNLIPFNPFPGSTWKRPDLDEINSFKEKLVQKKLRVMIRTTKGDDILAACGQLKINKLARGNV